MSDQTSPKIAGRRLDSWKEIAAFLRKDVRTVQRWEKNEGLPVHRKPHDKLSSVYAYEAELERWWNTGSHPDGERPASAGARRAMLAVLPLRNLSDDREQDYFSEGLTEELIGQLSRISPEHLGVIAHASAMAYQRSEKTIRQIARELGVDNVLEGSVRREGERVRISVALVRAADQTHAWSEVYDREIRHILEVQTEVARAVAGEIAVRVSPHAGVRQLLDPAAYNAYLRGRFFWNRRTPDSIARAIACFEEAVALDSSYARAYAGLADCHAMLSSIHIASSAPVDAMPKAIAAATRALKLDPELAEAHATLGHARLWYEWDWPGAAAAFARALELNPAYAPARQWYASYLQTIDRIDESLSELKRMLELDPLSLIARSAFEGVLYLERRYAEVVAESTRTLELDPAFVVSYFNLGRAHSHMGMHRDAIAELRRAHQLSNESPAMTMQLGYAYARAGKKSDARKMLAMLSEQARKRYVPAFHSAAILTGLGDIEHALDWLMKAREERCDYLVHLPKEPAADPLRGNPRFEALVPRPPRT